MINNKQIHRDLLWFTITSALLIVIGLIFIYSSSSVYALEKHGSAHFFVMQQLQGVFIGLIILFMALLAPSSLIKRFSPLLFYGSLGLTALTCIPHLAHRIHGSQRWLTLAGFTFQPSELLKITFIMYCAYFFSKKQYQGASFARTFIPFIVIVGLVGGVLLLQPDFGQAVTITTTACILFFIMYGTNRYFLYTLLAGIPLTLLLIFIKPYRVKRILTFLNPWDDPQGAGFQIIQSLIAIGSGHWLGVGIGQSKQKFFYLPMQHTDFIFSIIAEETGFLGATLLLFIYLFFLYKGIRLALKMTDLFTALVILGFTLLISIQAGINIAVTTGLLPTKGLGLPFISYGKSALICNISMLGIIINQVLFQDDHQ
ncbi:MAG: putative lipid II flippase FtsW [Candidatus Babeliaceae bacterium]